MTRGRVTNLCWGHVGTGPPGVNFVTNFVIFIKSPHFEGAECEGHRTQKGLQSLILLEDMMFCDPPMLRKPCYCNEKTI